MRRVKRNIIYYDEEYNNFYKHYYGQSICLDDFNHLKQIYEKTGRICSPLYYKKGHQKIVKKALFLDDNAEEILEMFCSNIDYWKNNFMNYNKENYPEYFL